MPDTDLAAYTNTDGYVERAKLAEKGKNYHPVVAGTPVQVADFLEESFSAGACDGF